MNNLYIFNALSESNLFKKLSKEQLEVLTDLGHLLKLGKNKMVYEMGSQKDYVYVVLKGSIKLAAETSCHKILTKELIYKNEIFGENIFGGALINNEFAETLEESTLAVLPIDIFKTLVSQNSHFASEIMKIIVQKFHQLEERLQNFVFMKAKERIVQFIYRSGEIRGKKIGIDECFVDHGMSHKEIAYLTDTSRQTVARIMNELKKENIIHYTSYKSGKVLIRDLNSIKNYTVSAS